MTRINRPGAPANPPQHLLTEEHLPPGGDTDRTRWKHRQTGPRTAPPEVDVADPHPSNEEHPYRERHPGGAPSPAAPRDHGREGQSARPAVGPRDRQGAGDRAHKTDIGPNPYVHDGTAPPRPRNVTNTR